jgi:hypothetical protein
MSGLRTFEGIICSYQLYRHGEKPIDNRKHEGKVAFKDASRGIPCLANPCFTSSLNPPIFMNFHYLPLSPELQSQASVLADEQTTTQIKDWLRVRYEHSKTVFARLASSAINANDATSSEQIDAVLNILTHRRFNHQSRSRSGSLMGLYRQKLAGHMAKGVPIPCFFLYNGGYRASPLAQQPLIFAPDQTEMLLLYQIARLTEDIGKTYPPGVHFFIVINNGVANWVNDIALTSTQAYAHGLNNLIDAIGARERVSVLLQSAMATFDAQPSLPDVAPGPALSDKNHRLVERFLGRPCSAHEARQRHALYSVAESHWAQVLEPLVRVQGGLLFRQVASPQMLSFRPYPGGATRIQNGSIGFAFSCKQPTPQLITTETTGHHAIRCVPWTAPWVSSV